MRIEYSQNPFSSSIFLTEEEKKKFLKKASKKLERNQNDCEFLLKELETGIHVGDCTCVAMTCEKCLAEWIAGTDTISGLGKHEGAFIYELFSKYSKHSAKEVLEIAISKGSIKKDGTWKDAYVKRWNQERKNAIEWLETYIMEKL